MPQSFTFTDTQRSMLAYAVNHLLECKPAEWWVGAMAEENKAEFQRLHDKLIEGF